MATQVLDQAKKDAVAERTLARWNDAFLSAARWAPGEDGHDDRTD